MKDQRTSQESEIVMSFLSPASPLESFELGPVFCPDAQMTFFFFRSEKKKLLLEKSKYNSVAEDQRSNILSQRDSNYGKRKRPSEVF